MASYIHGPKPAPAIPEVPAQPEGVLFGRSSVPEVHEGSMKTPTPESSPGHYLPCLNPSCKSHGRPHPNCRCYSGGGEYERFAGGGKVSFCSSDRAHQEGCEYYSGGGKIPSNEVELDQPNIPSNEVELDQPNIPSNEVQLDDDQQSDDGGYLEQAKAGAEGVSRGLLGALAPMAEVGLGISTKEAINKRQQDFPITSGLAEAGGFGAGLFFGTGEAGLIAKGAEAVSDAAKLGKIGSAIIKGGVEATSFGVSDEMTKAFLGQQSSDPEHPVSAALLHVGAAGLMGGLGGAAFTLGEGMIGKGLQSEAGAKAASQAQEFLFKLGQSGTPLTQLGLSAAAASVPAYKTSAMIEEKTGVPAWATYAPTEALYTLIGQKALSKINPVIIAATVKALEANEPDGVPNVFHYAMQALKGGKKKTDGIKPLFSAGIAKIAPDTSDFARKKLKEFIEGGQVSQQIQNSADEQNQQPPAFAQGGEVKSAPNDSFSKIFPAQNMLLNTAKGRISNYLNGLRPAEHRPRLAFDDAPASEEQTRQYEKAIDFAVNPMSILDHVNKGDLTPEHMQHFTSLYPEVHKFLSNEMTKQITEAQLDGKKPPYGKRQAMSLFLGATLDSTISPAAIQTIQGIYASQQQAQQQQAPTKPKKGTATLSKVSNSSLTDSQARQQRQQNSKS